MASADPYFKSFDVWYCNSTSVTNAIQIRHRQLKKKTWRLADAIDQERRVDFDFRSQSLTVHQNIFLIVVIDCVNEGDKNLH